MSESVAEKAQRLYDGGAVTFREELPDGTLRFTVTGDTHTYNVMSHVDHGERCDCESLVECSHTGAVEHWLGTDWLDDESGEPLIDKSDTPIHLRDFNRPVEVVDAADAPYDAETDLQVVWEPGEPGATEMPKVLGGEPQASLAIHDGNLSQMMLSPNDDIRNRAWGVLSEVCKTNMVPRQYQGNPAAALAAVLLGQDWGFGPLESLHLIDNIQGSTSPSAEARVRLFRRAGHRIENVEFYEDGSGVSMEGVRGDTGERMVVQYTMEDAKRQKLTDKDNWKKDPEAMLWARCATRLVRRLAPDAMDRPQ